MIPKDILLSYKSIYLLTQYKWLLIITENKIIYQKTII